MITRKNIYIGARIIENDPEEPTPHPYKGTVKEIYTTGDGAYDYFAIVELDKESMKQQRIAQTCPQGIMHCFSFLIDLLDNETEKTL